MNLLVEELKAINESELIGLTELLKDVVEEGASIGFLHPISAPEAELYWKSVLSSDVLLWVARTNGRIVGTVQLHLDTKPNATHRAEIAKLMVHPELRGKGIGKQLMLSAEATAQRINRELIVLDTRLGDVSNLLYKKLGYTEAGQIPHFAKSSNGQLDGTVIYYKMIK
ncbi:GNAT family N-acetyltransferase [Caldalkalibacillus salinus]|uniref:GNAT family N-acetyltransferase n=1 Tax=Caldalkalibacillus salinus TaxID=2803787 RepID=UPI0019230F7E|nr:GNAT family N-acetyltransferase [Caldalkalibacillus salinus]